MSQQTTRESINQFSVSVLHSLYKTTSHAIMANLCKF